MIRRKQTLGIIQENSGNGIGKFYSYEPRYKTIKQKMAAFERVVTNKADRIEFGENNLRIYYFKNQIFKCRFYENE